MKKILISQREDAIKAQSKYYSEVAANCNAVLTAFSSHNYFNITLEDAQMFELVKNPVAFFDNLLLKNNPIPTLGSIKPNIEAIASTLGIDRPGFIQACTLPVPGTAYRSAPYYNVFRLNPVHSKLLAIKNGLFEIDETEFDSYCEQFRIYAESEQDFSLVETVENMVNSINEGLKLGIINKVYIGSIYQLCNLIDSRGYECVVHHKNLGSLIEVNHKQAARMSV